jgi:NADPH2:quinone reductase
VLGNEGAGIVEGGGTVEYPKGSRVMFTGPYGVLENGTLSELVAVQKEHLCVVPDNVDAAAAAGLPVAYLTAFLTLKAAGFKAGKTVLAPAIGGSVGNATTQLARALGAKHAISTTTSHAKAEQAKERGFSEVIDPSEEALAEGVRRLTDGYGEGSAVLIKANRPELSSPRERPDHPGNCQAFAAQMGPSITCALSGRRSMTHAASGPSPASG